MKINPEITVDMQLCDIIEAIFEYLYNRGLDCQNCPCEFTMTEKGGNATLACKITGAKEINA